jgi:ribose transport system permease protein
MSGELDRPRRSVWVALQSRLVAAARARTPADIAFLSLFAVLIVAAALTTDRFLTAGNLWNISRQLVANGLVSLGQLLVILTGGIDLSVGPLVALGGIVAVGEQERMPLAAAILVGLLVGTLGGTLNGVLVARAKLPPFIVTLATMSAYRGLVFVYSDTPQQPTDPMFRNVLGAGSIGPIPTPVAIVIAFYIAAWFFLNRSIPGRTMTAVGGNAEATRLAGYNVERTKILAYSISGFTSALAGVLLVARLGIAQPSLGVAYELDAIAATVIGGAVLGGGGGSVGGTAGGVVVLAVINNLLNLLNVQAYWQQIAKGAIIIAAVMARRRER